MFGCCRLFPGASADTLAVKGQNHQGVDEEGTDHHEQQLDDDADEGGEQHGLPGHVPVAVADEGHGHGHHRAQTRPDEAGGLLGELPGIHTGHAPEMAVAEDVIGLGGGSEQVQQSQTHQAQGASQHQHTQRHIQLVKNRPKIGQQCRGIHLPQQLFQKIGHLFLLQDLGQLPHEAVDVLELTVHRGEADVADLVQGLEPLHDHLADVIGADLPLHGVHDGLLDLIGDALELRDGHGAVDAGVLQTGQDLLLVEVLAGAVLLHHHHGQALHHLIGGEPPLTAQTFPPTADGEIIVRVAGIHHLAFLVTAEGTFHGYQLLKVNSYKHYSRGENSCPVDFSPCHPTLSAVQ